jgi:N-acetylglucosaminyldiphosphoundecaprenol N-acetyl-beta-D-mannosaminyltransferase
MTLQAERGPSGKPSEASTMPELSIRRAGADRGGDAPKAFPILGVWFDAMQIPDVIRHMRQWIAGPGGCRYIAVTGMHGIMEARRKVKFKRALAEADLVVADGMPVVWIGRFRGFHLPRRVYGPELMLRFCQETASAGYRHYLFGGVAGVPEQLALTLEKLCPGLTIIGTHSPPFGSSTPEQDKTSIDDINRVTPDVLWVGLGTPKQEMWMHEHRNKLRVPVMIGVGAAFDFLSCRKRQAPPWMQELGLEWFYRLLQEPLRLWKRYLISGVEFVFLVLLELLGFRRFE